MYDRKAVKKYSQSVKGKAAHLKANKRYWRSEKGNIRFVTQKENLQNKRKHYKG